MPAHRRRSPTTPTPTATPLTAALVTDARQRHPDLNTDGTFTYTPNANFTGTDTFTYSVSDGTAAPTRRPSPSPSPRVNDAPVADNDAYTVAEDTALTVPAAPACSPTTPTPTATR